MEFVVDTLLTLKKALAVDESKFLHTNKPLKCLATITRKEDESNYYKAFDSHVS